MFPKIRRAEEEQIPPRKGRPGGARTLIMRKARGSTVQEEEGQPKVEKKSQGKQGTLYEGGHGEQIPPDEDGKEGHVPP